MLRTCCSAAVLVFALGSSVHAETLKEALTAAYLYNPTLKSARAQLRATDNQVPLAKSGYRPTISAQFQYGYEDVRTKIQSGTSTGSLPLCSGTITSTGTCNGTATPLPLSTLASNSAVGNGEFNPRQAQLALQENIFDGFRTYNSIKAAEASVEAGREDLRNSEITVLLNAATAYMNVVRDQAIVNLRQNNVKVLAEQLRATQDRFKVGEVTRTDVAQAESGLAQSQADLSIAQGTLYGDQALFAQYIGHPPGTLRDPGPPDKAAAENLAGRYRCLRGGESRASLARFSASGRKSIRSKEVKGQLLPSLTLNASYTRAAQPFGEPNATDLRRYARVRSAHRADLRGGERVRANPPGHRNACPQRRQQVDEQRELARQNVSSQWGLVIAARGNVAAGKSAVEATRIALEGVREEERVGQRTILDVLNSEQQYLNAQVNLVSFQRDLVVASYGVLAYTRVG